MIHSMVSFETLFIHVLWASVSSATLYVGYKSVERYTAVKYLETFALASEKIGTVILHLLKAREGDRLPGKLHLPNGTQKKYRHPDTTSTETQEDHKPHTDSLFDLRD